MHSKKIIIIDNDHDILRIMEYILLEEGYDVQTATDAIALDVLAADPPGLILLDIWLDDSSGYDMCKQIKSNPGTAHIPVIMISAINNLAATAKLCGADAYLDKPFDVVDLISKVKDFI